MIVLCIFSDTNNDVIKVISYKRFHFDKILVIFCCMQKLPEFQKKKYFTWKKIRLFYKIRCFLKFHFMSEE